MIHSLITHLSLLDYYVVIECSCFGSQLAFATRASDFVSSEYVTLLTPRITESEAIHHSDFEINALAFTDDHFLFSKTFILSIRDDILSY